MPTANPNRTYITDDMWWLWLACNGFIPGVRLGGIYANKPGNHNTVNANLANWPNNYSVRNPIDRRDPRTKSRAIDLTMDSTWMRTITKRLLDGTARRDQRMRCVKEFYGTVDGRNVVGRIKDSEDGAWRSASSDTSHLWHEHVGIHTPYVDDREALEGLVSLLQGESWESWIARKYGGQAPTLPVSGIPDPLLREGVSGAAVVALQVYLNAVINAGLIEDGDFGPATTAAVRELQRRAGITQDGIYGQASADALRSLLEDDMSWDTKLDLVTDQGINYSADEWPAGFVLTSAHFYIMKLLAEQKASRLREEAILAAVKGVDTKAVIAAVNAAAAADAQRDAALLAEIRGLISGGASAQAIVDEIAARLGVPVVLGEGE